MDNIFNETKEFAKQYTPKKGDEIILWQGSDNVGLTILREYPKDIPFKPAKTKNGQIDSVCMIKIGSPLRKINTDSNHLKLFVMVSKASKYLLNNHFDYDFNNQDSPTRDSIEESKRSKQPIDLDDFNGYVFDRENNKIFFIENGIKEVTLNDVVEKIYKLHIKTVKLAGAWFRFKVSIKDKIANPIEGINKSILWFIDFLFGKTVQEEKNNLKVGLFEKYKHSDLYTLSDEKIDIFNTGLKIPKKTGLLTAFSIVVITILLTYSLPAYPKLWIEIKEQSQIVQVSFLLVVLWVIDYLIPHLFLSVINMLIMFRIKVWDWKIKIK